MTALINYLVSAIKFSTFFLFGSTGETITEKSGHLNLGTPGVICVGASCGYWGGYLYWKSVSSSGGTPNAVLAVLIPVLFTLIGSGLMGLLFSFLTVTLRANQNVTGLMLTTFGVGLGLFIYNGLTPLAVEPTSKSALGKYFSTLFAYEKLGNFGKLFFSYGILVYLSIVIAVLTSFVLKKTRVGLHLQAVGENPATADSAGINVSAYRYLSTIIGTSISGLAGLFFVFENGWDSGLVSTEALGWLALSLVIFSVWRPNIGILGSILFSALYRLPYQNWVPNDPALTDFIKMLPYLVTILVLVLTSVRKKRETQPPAALGLSYFREDR